MTHKRHECGPRKHTRVGKQELMPQWDVLEVDVLTYGPAFEHNAIPLNNVCVISRRLYVIDLDVPVRAIDHVSGKKVHFQFAANPLEIGTAFKPGSGHRRARSITRASTTKHISHVHPCSTQGQARAYSGTRPMYNRLAIGASTIWSAMTFNGTAIFKCPTARSSSGYHTCPKGA